MDVEQLRRRPAPSGRTNGRALAIGFVAALAVAWLVTQHHSSGSPVPAAIAPPSSTTAPPRARQLPNGIRLDEWTLGTTQAATDYRARMGAMSASSGPPACARGLPDERAWSRPETPTTVAGRYRCVLEQGHAAMWWTDDHGRLAHAVAPDADLAALFNWWRAFDG